VPDLAVDVRSPGTEGAIAKMDLLVRFGVTEYRIVDPARNTIQINVLRAGAYERCAAAGADATVSSPTLPDLSVARRVFAK